MRLSHQTSQEIISYEGERVLSSGVKFDHRETLKKINCHKRMQFYNCEDTSAIFRSLGYSRAIHFSKKLDLDTRHFKIEGYGDYNAYQAWICNIRFRKWVKSNGFPIDLDDLGDALGDFGSTVLKLTEKKDGSYDINECDLMKLWFDPTIKSFHRNTKIELHELEEHDLEKMNGWKKKEKAWEKAQDVDYFETEKSDIITQVIKKKKFWERIGYFNVAHYKNEDILNGEYIETSEKNIWKFMHTIHCGVGDDEIIVYAEEIKPEDDIYVDLHISKYEDRWLRIGIYERLFPLQKLVNEIVNYDKQAQQISSLLLFKTRNKKLVGSNILQNVESGLITDADLEQIGATNTFANEFVGKLNLYEMMADKICLTPDVLTGEGSDVKTFRGQASLTNMANSAFKKARDRIGFIISDVIVKKILPKEIKGWNKEKTLEIAGFDTDVRIYDAIAIIYHLNNYIEAEFEKGRNPTEEEKALFIEKIKNDVELKGRKLKLPENYFDFEFGLGINATGESENKEQQNDVYYNVITWILANPAAIYIPAFREYVEKNGLTPFHLTSEQVQQIQAGQQGGQQVATPTGRQDKLMSQIDTT